jgi:hypothetical protein
MRTLARDRDCSEETIRRHLRDIVAAGLVRIEKRGRGNVYRFPDDHMFWAAASPADAPVRAREASPPSPPRTKPVAPPAVKRPLRESPDTGKPEAPIAHGFVGQGFTREKIHTSPPHGGDSSVEERQGQPTALTLVAHGVSPGTAAKLASSYGYAVCEEAIRSLIAYQAAGAAIRNPGGWLYRAITQGFVRVAEAEQAPPVTPTEVDVAAETERLRLADEAHVAELRQRRRKALEAQGIGEETEALWQRINDRLRERGLWAPVLAATCLRQLDEGTYAVQCRAPRLSVSLGKLLPAIREVVQKEVPGAFSVTLLTPGESN